MAAKQRIVPLVLNFGPIAKALGLENGSQLRRHLEKEYRRMGIKATPNPGFGQQLFNNELTRLNLVTYSRLLIAYNLELPVKSLFAWMTKEERENEIAERQLRVAACKRELATNKRATKPDPEARSEEAIEKEIRAQQARLDELKATMKADGKGKETYRPLLRFTLKDWMVLKGIKNGERLAVMLSEQYGSGSNDFEAYGSTMRRVLSPNFERVDFGTLSLLYSLLGISEAPPLFKFDRRVPVEEEVAGAQGKALKEPKKSLGAVSLKKAKPRASKSTKVSAVGVTPAKSKSVKQTKPVAEKAAVKVKRVVAVQPKADKAAKTANKVKGTSDKKTLSPAVKTAADKADKTKEKREKVGAALKAMVGKAEKAVKSKPLVVKTASVAEPAKAALAPVKAPAKTSPVSKKDSGGFKMGGALAALKKPRNKKAVTLPVE